MMLSLTEKIVLTLLVLATVFVFFLPVLKRIRILLSCQPENRFDSPFKRFFYVLSRVFLQLCTLRNERIFTGLAHVMIFYGALAFDTMTVNHVLEGYVDDFYLFDSSRFGLIFYAAVDFFAITVLLGVSFFAFKRFVLKPKAYDTTPGDSALIYAFIFLAIVTYVYFETFFVASHPGSSPFAFISQFLVHRFNLTALLPAAISANLKFSYWLHTLVVFSFIAYVPHSKYLHLFAGPVNLFFKKHEPSGTIKPINMDTTENFGAGKATDLTWKDALDSFACVECGRCQDVCPAFQSGKALSPKMVILNLEAHLLSSCSTTGEKKPDNRSSLVPGVFKEEEIWACTTCGACLHVCPFDIEHPEKLISLRQNLVLSQAQFPVELRSFFHNLETYANPWGIASSRRADWVKELGIKTVAEAPEASYLLWVGCFGSFDEQGRKIARSVAEILIAAGISFAILGEEERCCGDSARRLGNEYLFQNLARENLKTLARHKVSKLITFCPHGYNVLRNEYPVLVDMLNGFGAEEREFIKSMRVISHVEFLAHLLKENLVHLKHLTDDACTYHDSCYYGRHNGLFEQPRQILSAALAGKIRELKNSREHSFCCGAGGGLMWTEEKVGKRINHLRSEEIIKSRSRRVATSCPFCLTMLQDGLRDKGAEEIKVLDVAQILAQALRDQSHPE